MLETPAPRFRAKSHEAGSGSRPFTQNDLLAHPLMRRNSSEPPSGAASVTAELVVLNRTSSFSKITYELTETADVTLVPSPSAQISPSKAAQKPVASKPLAHKHLAARLGILLSRSSGRDKFAALVQYFSMFVGHQTVVAVSQDGNAPWRNVEESMSSGRKVLRLLKWIKELERVQRSVTHEDIGPHATKARALIARVLGFFMHSFSTLYYMADNILWSSQVGLINRPPVAEEGSHRRMLSMDLPLQEYIQLQHKHRADEALRKAARSRESMFKDWKNMASFSRLVLCIAYCSLQLDSVAKERLRLETKIAGMSALDVDDAQVVDSDSTSPDEEGEDDDASEAEREAAVVARLRAQFRDLDDMDVENRRELWASVFNLLILLRRLELGVFARVPLWCVGLLGVGSSFIGLQKNWPVVQG